MSSFLAAELIVTYQLRNKNVDPSQTCLCSETWMSTYFFFLWSSPNHRFALICARISNLNTSESFLRIFKDSSDTSIGAIFQNGMVPKKYTFGTLPSSQHSCSDNKCENWSRRVFGEQGSLISGMLHFFVSNLSWGMINSVLFFLWLTFYDLAGVVGERFVEKLD